MKKKPAHRGRRRFKSKLAQVDGISLPVGAIPQRQWILESRKRLFKYLPDPAQWPPPTFASVANGYLLSQREFPSGLWKQLKWNEQLNDKSGDFNAEKLPRDLLKKAMSSNPSLALDFRVVRRELSRLYSVAWHGRGAESAEAKRQVEQLLPKGKRHFTTAYLPELATRFLRLKREIANANKRIQQEHPRYTEKKRKDMLVELYAEDSDVIWASIHTAEKTFVVDRLSKVLVIPFPTVQVNLRRWKPA